MSPPSPPAFEALPEAVVVPVRRSRLQLVWLLPLLAALIGGYLAVRAYLERGPTITIQFKSGEGLEPGKTRIKFKDVDIGQLVRVRLADNRDQVEATVQLVKEAEGLLVDDTRFWVVRPRISAGNVSGLGTLLSGSYIGVDAGHASTPRRHFVGQETPPVVTLDVPGRTVRLSGRSLGSLDIGSPVYFRRVRVGQVVSYALSPAGEDIEVGLFVQAPHDRFVREDSRFWHASGIDFSVGADGMQLNTESLTALMIGGVAFDNPEGAPERAPAPPEARFTLFDRHADAMKAPDRHGRNYRLTFNESIRGLTVGAPVELRGLPIGEVIAIDARLHPDTGELGLEVEVRLYPERLRRREARGGAVQSEAAYRAGLEAMVRRGLRAQLRPASLVTGQLLVALDFFPEAPPFRLDWSQPVLALPTVGGSLEELQNAALRIARKIDQLPVEALLGQLRGTLGRLDRLLGAGETLVRRMDAQLVDEARETLVAARRLLGEDAPLQLDARDTLDELNRAARALRQLADSLERHPEALLRGRPAAASPPSPAASEVP